LECTAGYYAEVGADLSALTVLWFFALVLGLNLKSLKKPPTKPVTVKPQLESIPITPKITGIIDPASNNINIGGVKKITPTSKIRGFPVFIHQPKHRPQANRSRLKKNASIIIYSSTPLPKALIWSIGNYLELERR